MTRFELPYCAAAFKVIVNIRLLRSLHYLWLNKLVVERMVFKIGVPNFTSIGHLFVLASILPKLLQTLQRKCRLFNTVRLIQWANLTEIHLHRFVRRRSGEHEWFSLLKWLLSDSNTICRMKTFWLSPPNIRCEPQNLERQITDSKWHTVQGFMKHVEPDTNYTNLPSVYKILSTRLLFRAVLS